MAFYLVPRWFFGVDIALELVFALITMAVAVYSLYIYKLCAQKECRLFGFSFIFISLAYFFWSFVNLFIVSSLNASTRQLSLDNISTLGAVGVYGHILLLTLGFATLAYITLGLEGRRSYSLFASLPLLLIIFSEQKALAFYFVSSLLLLYVAVHYFLEYYLNRKKTTLLLLAAFTLIFVGNVSFTFAAIMQVHYVTGHLLVFLGYILILASFILTLKKQ